VRRLPTGILVFEGEDKIHARAIYLFGDTFNDVAVRDGCDLRFGDLKFLVSSVAECPRTGSLTFCLIHGDFCGNLTLCRRHFMNDHTLMIDMVTLARCVLKEVQVF